MTEASSYQQFVGRKVNLVEVKHEYAGKTFSHFDVAKDDPTIEEIKKLIDPKRLRVWTPGVAGTMDFQPTRLNVYIDETGSITRINYG